MATARVNDVACNLVQSGTLKLKPEVDLDPWYTSLVLLSKEKVIVVDYNAMNVRLHRILDGRQIAEYKPESRPIEICICYTDDDKTQMAVCLDTCKIEILSVKCTDETPKIQRMKSFNVQTSFDSCYGLKYFNKKLVVSGGKQDILCWGIVSITDGRIRTVKNICKWSKYYTSFMCTNKKDMVYISCNAGDEYRDNSGVYGYKNYRREFLYQHKHLKYPNGVTVDTRGHVFVCSGNPPCIHVLTESGQPLTIHRRGIHTSSELIAIEWDKQQGLLYVTSYKSNVITRYRPEYSDDEDPVIPAEVLKMDTRSLQMYKEALRGGKEKVYNIRVMVVGQYGVGKTTLTKRLLGKDVHISERKSTEGIDIDIECSKVSLETGEWTAQEKNLEQDYRLQRLAKVLIEKQSAMDSIDDRNEIVSPSQGGRTPDSSTIVAEKKQDKMDPERKVLTADSNANVADDVQTIIPQEEITPGSNTNDADKEQVKMDPMKEMIKLLQENADKLKQDTGKTSPLTVWDFAGQYAFYTTHQTFLTRRAIYLLVSDVSGHVTDLVDDECYFDSEGITKCRVHELIEVWLNSIHSCAPSPEASIPPVILVGTHVDKITQKQLPAKGIELETTITSSETEEFTLPTTSTPGAATSKEQPKNFSSLMNFWSGANALPTEDQLKKQRKLKLRSGKKKRVETDVMAAPSAVNPVGGKIVDVDLQEKQLPAKGIELETTITSSETEEFTLPTTSTPGAATSKEQPKNFSSLMNFWSGANALPAEDQLKKQRKLKLRSGKKKRVETDVMAAPSAVNPVGGKIVDVDLQEKQLPAKGIELETTITSSETEEFTLPTTSTPGAATSKEQPKNFSSLMNFWSGANALPAEDQLKKQRKLKLRSGKKKRVETDIMAAPSAVNPVGGKIVDVDLQEKQLPAKGIELETQITLSETEEFTLPTTSTPAAATSKEQPKTLVNFSSLLNFWSGANALPAEDQLKKQRKLKLRSGKKKRVETDVMAAPSTVNPVGEKIVDVDLQEINHHEICERYFREIRTYLRDKPTRFHLVNEDFAIDNTIVDSKLENLKRKIVEVASKQSYWGEEIPTRWLPLEQELMRLKAAGVKVVTWSLLENLNQAGAVKIATDELDLFLRFQHDIGTILYFSIEALKDKIVLDPQWMIDALKSLITAKMFVLRSAPAVADKWFGFEKSGKLSPELIDAIWTKQNNPDFHDNKEHILLLMEHLNIISKPRCYNEDGSEIKVENYFLAPCMLKETTPREVISPEPQMEMKSSSVLSYIFMGKFLPPAIFHRLLATCVAHWPIAKKKSENLIFCGCGVFSLDLHHRLTVFFKGYIIFVRVTRMGITEKTPSSELCIEVREFITMTLSNIIGYLGQSLQFELFVRCPKSDGYSVDCLIPLADFQENEDVPCHCHDNSHVIRSHDVLKFWFQEEEHSDDGSSAGLMPPPSTSETDRFMHIAYLLVDVGSQVLRHLLSHHTITPSITLDQYLANNRNTINSLLKKKVLNISQMGILFPSNGSNSNLDEYDITLLSALFNNIVPSLSQQEKSMIKALREDRNKLYGHAKSCKMNAHDYQTCWNSISSTLITLSKQCMDPDFANEILQEIQHSQVSGIPAGSYLDILKTWFGRIETVEESIETFGGALQALTSRVDALELKKPVDESNG